MPWYDPSPKPNRQYIIRSWRCRQRTAQRLGAGEAPAAVAAIERLQAGEVDALLSDAGFVALVEHYREIAALPQDERRRRLVEEAMRLLELGLAAGDLRVAMFVLHEEARGRSPAEALVDAVIRQDARLAAPPAEPALAQPTHHAAREHAAGRREPAAAAPFAPPAAPTLSGNAGAEFAACAAVQPDAAAAEALALAELGRVGRRLAATRARLLRQLRDEVERAGTAGIAATPDEPRGGAHLVAAARTFASIAHAAPERAFGAARDLDHRMRAFRDGEPPPRSAVAERLAARHADYDSG